MPDIPEKLFKYRSFDKDGFYKDILQNKLYFASPLQFNDPFDCKIIPAYEDGSKQEIFEHLTPAVRKKYPALTKKEAFKNFNREFPNLKNPDHIREVFEEMTDKSTGVFSMAEKNDNLLMWSHYANSHQGFCVEFNAVKLFEICDNYKMINELIFHKKVMYDSKYPMLTPYKRKTESSNTYVPYKDFKDPFTFKSDCWEYEQEWRLIYKDHPKELLKFEDDEIITAIYFGVQCSDEHIQEVIELTSNRKNKLEYYKGKTRRFEFGIDFEKI